VADERGRAAAAQVPRCHFQRTVGTTQPPPAETAPITVHRVPSPPAIPLAAPLSLSSVLAASVLPSASQTGTGLPCLAVAHAQEREAREERREESGGREAGQEEVNRGCGGCACSVVLPSLTRISVCARCSAPAASPRHRNQQGSLASIAHNSHNMADKKVRRCARAHRCGTHACLSDAASRLRRCADVCKPAP
jgi:hypothetical protein